MLLYFGELRDDMICNFAIYDIKLCSEFDGASNLWQRLEMASKLGSVFIDIENNTGAVAVEIDRSVFYGQLLLKMLALPLTSILDWGVLIRSIRLFFISINI